MDSGARTEFPAYSKDMLTSVEAEIAMKKIKFVFLEYCDLHAMQRGKVVPAARFVANASEGFLISGMQMVRLPKGGIPPMPEVPLSAEFNDFRFFPDLETFKAIPWMSGVASVIVDPYELGGKPVGYSSRQVARVQVERLKEHGLRIVSALEYEFSLLDAKTLIPVHKDGTGHWVQHFLNDWDFLENTYDNLTGMGLTVEQIDSEGEYGVYEFPIKPSKAVQAGDDGFWLKKTIRESAKQRGYFASFSSKPFFESSGVGGHFNHSLTNSSRGKLFYDSDEPSKISKIMQHWLAGLILLAPAMTVFGCPTASCQRRFANHDAATPQYPDWGIDNRTCSFRVKNYTPEETYIENRIFAAGCNSYLALAVNIAAGLDGIVNELPLPPMVKGSAYSAENVAAGTERFSGRLTDAVAALEKDKVLCEALGSDFIRIYLNAKRHECSKEENANAAGNENFYDREYLPYL